jgi:hypothetical protein
MLFGFVSIFLVRLGTSPSDIRAYTLDHHMHTRGMIKQVSSPCYIAMLLMMIINDKSELNIMSIKLSFIVTPKRPHRIPHCLSIGQ